MDTRILLADSDDLVREGISCLLEKRKGFRVVRQVADGENAVRRIESDKPDVAILEYSLSRLSGVGAIERVTRGRSGTRCIVLSSRRGEQQVCDALRVGAAGYLLKSASASQLIEAVETVREGLFYYSPDVAGFVVAAARHPDQMMGNRLLHLTSREREVLQLVAEGQTTKEVAATLGISSRTSDCHRARVMKKVGVHRVVDLVRFAIREGLVEA